MIKIDRNRVQAPPALAVCARAQYPQAESYYARSEGERRQRIFKFELVGVERREVLQHLDELFMSKCAYCETPLPEPAYDRFRPAGGALDLSGQASDPHYWWLAFEWANFYLSCPVCNGNKSSRFPVDGPRARVKLRGRALATERPLLLDPCHDEPLEHLTYDRDGFIRPLSERGATTIKALGFNRPYLLDCRKEQMRELEQAFRESERDYAWIAAAVAPRQPFSAFRAWALADLAKAMNDLDVLHSLTALGWGPFTGVTPSWSIEAAEADVQRRQAFSLEDDQQNMTVFYEQKQRIERVRFKDFGILDALDLQFPEPSSFKESWLVLLGDNAVGKSTILEGIALTLMGEERANQIKGVHANSYVRRGQKEGQVEVWLSGQWDPITLTVRRGERRFSVSPPQHKVILLGYGATRLMRRGKKADGERATLRIENLFKPWVKLNDFATWFKQASEHHREQARSAVTTLLGVNQDATLEVENGQVVLFEDGVPSRFRDLSDGYQSVIALVGDIVMTTLVLWPKIAVAEGIVLIDEIEVHLHPRWKLTIIPRLREAFPRMTFVTTTHDPLCLSTLDASEIVVLARTANGQLFPAKPPSDVKDYGADQLLTSPLFGLASTRPELDVAAREYAQLVGEQTAPDEQRLQALRRRLADAYGRGETTLQRVAEVLLQEVLEAHEVTLRASFEQNMASVPHDAVAAFKTVMAAIVREGSR